MESSTNEKQIPCPQCGGTGSTNPPGSTFFAEGDTPIESRSCVVCDGEGYITKQEAIAARCAHLVSNQIEEKHAIPSKNVYQTICTNIKGVVNANPYIYNKVQIAFPGDYEVFSNDKQEGDEHLNKFIDDKDILRRLKDY